MPEGVETYVDDGFAVIDFTDAATRGPGLAKLLESTPAELVETITREGPRRKYRVPESNARDAGLLDMVRVDPHPVGDTGFAAALAAAPTDGGRPEPQTVDGRAYGSGQGTYTGPLRPGVATGQEVTDTADVLGTQSVQTTVEGSPGFGGGMALAHAELQARLKGQQTGAAYPSDEPSKVWNRAQIDAYAAEKGVDTTQAETKAEAVALIKERTQ